MAKKREDPPPVPPPGKMKYTCDKCGTEYSSLSDALACPCRSGGESSC